MTALRSLPVDELVAVLVSEHAKMKDGLGRVRAAAMAGDFPDAKKALKEVEGVFRQHIADEEGQVLRLLIGVYGRKGAEGAIEVFRQHRPIYALMESIERLSSLPREELAAEQDELISLFEGHAASEEKSVFPRAVSAADNRPDRPASPIV